MIARLLVETFNCVSQIRARHRGGMFVQKVEQSLPIAFAGFAQPATGRLVDQVVRVSDQDFSQLKSVINVTLPDETPGADDRGASLPDIFRARQFVKDLAWLVQK